MEKQMKLGFSSLESAGVGALWDAGELRGCIACTRKKQEAQYPRKDSQISAQEFLLRTPTNGIGLDVINRQKAASENLPGAGGGSKKKEPRKSGAPQRDKFRCPASVRLLLFVPVGVHGGELLPLLRKIFKSENRSHRANRDASAAIDAFHRIDVEHRFGLVGRLVLARVDAVHRTDINTRGVFGVDARFGNHISHANSPSLRVAGRG